MFIGSAYKVNTVVQNFIIMTFNAFVMFIIIAYLSTTHIEKPLGCQLTLGWIVRIRLDQVLFNYRLIGHHRVNSILIFWVKNPLIKKFC